MRMGVHEAVDMHEILSASATSIEHHALYTRQVDDPQLRTILERHKDRMVQDYNAAVNLMRGRGVNADAYHARAVHDVHYGIQPGQPTRPHPDTSKLSDRVIASGALHFHKCGAVNAMKASLEMADADLRQFLITKSITCNNMAYELFHWMNQKGFYQVPMMEQDITRHMQNMYAPVGAPMAGVGVPFGAAMPAGIGAPNERPFA